MITLQEFLHTPQFIMLALEKGHADYEDWFNTSQFDAGDSVPVKCTLYTNDYLDLELVITP